MQITPGTRTPNATSSRCPMVRCRRRNHADAAASAIRLHGEGEIAAEDSTARVVVVESREDVVIVRAVQPARRVSGRAHAPSSRPSELREIRSYGVKTAVKP